VGKLLEQCVWRLIFDAVSGFDDLITLKVGQEKKVFTVHKRILCDSSPFFESACKPEWMISDERIIELPEDDPVAIDHMLYWMYFDQVSIPKRHMSSNQGVDSGMDSAAGLIAKMYVLGQKYQIPRLRNEIVDACYEWMDDPKKMPTTVLNYVWENTPPESPLRILLLGRIVECYPHDMLTQAANKLAPELVKDLMIQFCLEKECHAESGCEDVSIGYNMHADYCYRYHVHDQDEMRRCPAWLDDPDMPIIWVDSDN